MGRLFFFLQNQLWYLNQIFFNFLFTAAHLVQNKHSLKFFLIKMFTKREDIYKRAEWPDKSLQDLLKIE